MNRNIFLEVEIIMELVFGILLVVLAVFLIVAVLFQQGSEDGLSGTIVGGSESFFGKGKEKKKDKALFIATAVVSALFGIIILVMNIFVA